MIVPPVAGKDSIEIIKDDKVNLQVYLIEMLDYVLPLFQQHRILVCFQA